MKNRRFLMRVGFLAALFAISTFAEGQQPSTDDSEAVRRAEARFHQAFVAADTKTLDALLTPDFVWMHGDGAIWPKAQLLDELRSGKLSYKRDEIDGVKITVYGATAIVVGHDERQYGNGESLDFNYTMTYAKQNGEWRVAVFHSSHCPCAQPKPQQK
ncbi:MAG TPA: nuclear transport factor 2 family protein [Terriglobales bacterium]|nr:nuclear transport factor 2 family protein [Terriglobales bacterium]